MTASGTGPADASADGARVVVVTGATGATGRATCAALLAHGERVVAVGRDEATLAALRDELSGAGDDRLDTHLQTRVCDLLDGDAVQELAREVIAEHGHVDALFHLVGGWRGGKHFAQSTDDDWRWLSGNLVDTLRHTTLSLHDALLASGRGRVAIISAAAAQAPTAGNAAYASAKAAAETWLAALADSFGSEDATPGSAAVVGVVKWIGTGRTATSPARIAEWLTELLDGDASALNGTRVEL
ncbi:oxidoreductase [Terrabacter tumescens]|uniref:Oxidoreductase n=1 Tax=Terrabacter tumescens TaxID=60443 RepID=A0ABQ2HQF0_9MICO|nr:SDR family NAD(P)-dependent oxidoreductase [Terrabacter tumescens]GGM87169.1 oxidoreductase [Terrabacter tumescens]